MHSRMLVVLFVASLAGCLDADEGLAEPAGDATTATKECLAGEVVLSITTRSFAPEPLAGALPHPVEHSGTETFAVSGNKTYLAMKLEAENGDLQAHYRFTVRSGSDVLHEFDLTSESSGWHAAWAAIENIDRPDTLSLDWALSGAVPQVSYEVVETDCPDPKSELPL